MRGTLIFLLLLLLYYNQNKRITWLVEVIIITIPKNSQYYILPRISENNEQ
jgi:hypothetical protein